MTNSIQLNYYRQSIHLANKTVIGVGGRGFVSFLSLLLLLFKFIELFYWIGLVSARDHDRR